MRQQFYSTQIKPWKRKLISWNRPPKPYRRYEWVIRAAPVYIRHYTKLVMLPGYAFLIRLTNNRRPKRTK